MLAIDPRARRCCCHHYTIDYIALHPEYDPDEPIGERILRIAREAITE